MYATAATFAVLIASTISFSAPASSASAADLSQFDPGNIIDDAVFFDGGAMNAGEVQSFLNSKVGSCQRGYTCLKDYRQDTPTRAADPMCGGYSGASQETAATIIARVAQSCGISPKVIIVTLQKEQGLVTSTAPSDTRYMIAMGQGCPDTAACDSAYYGFFNQVFGAARQFKRYANPPGTSNYFTWYAPGRTWNIQYNPNVGCGSSPVYIANQATANLYYYTPYQPNRAALAAGYGLGDTCSSYGNRNFFQYFIDWFGSTRGVAVIGAMKVRYDALGGTSGALGKPLGPQHCGLVRGGCYQVFENGLIYLNPDGYAFEIMNAIRPGWGPTAEYGWLGYPISGTSCGLTRGGCYQVFEGGAVYWSPTTGAHPMGPPISQKYGAMNAEWGSLGYPTGDIDCGLRDGGCWQKFESGSLYAHAGTTVFVSDSIRSGWSGFQEGPLGYPLGEQACGLTQGGCYQVFQGGTVYWSPLTGGQMVRTELIARYAAENAEWGRLGYPVAPTVCGLAQNGCSQEFQRGRIYWTAVTGGQTVLPAVLSAWNPHGAESGPVGYPTTSAGTTPSYTQSFQGGVVTVTNSTGMLTSATDPWVAAKIATPTLGGALSDVRCGLSHDGCYQVFQGGSIFASPATGAFAIRTEVITAWAPHGAEWGPLGYPTSNPSQLGDTYDQTFQGGRMSVVNDVAQLVWATDPWVTAKITSPDLGAPLSDVRCGLSQGGCYQVFQRGSIFSSPGTGTYSIRPEVVQIWGPTGAEWGPHGYPTSNPSSTGDSYSQTFQSGTVTVTNGVARW